MRSLAEIAERRAVAQDDSLAQLEAECRGSQVDPEFRVTWSFIPSLKKPVIAAVNGPCAGMSTAIATMCDLRFASDSAVFTTSFSQRGLVAEHGLSWILPRLLGPAKALDLPRPVTSEPSTSARASRSGYFIPSRIRANSATRPGLPTPTSAPAEPMTGVD